MRKPSLRPAIESGPEAGGIVTLVAATVCVPPWPTANFLVDPNARSSISPRTSGEPPTSSVVYVPSRKPATATDLALERESVGVKGENTLPIGETMNTMGQRSPEE